MENRNEEVLTPEAIMQEDGALTPRVVEPAETLTPKAVEVQMNFFDALHAIVDNKRVARVDWKNTDYCLMSDGKLSIFIGGKIRPWIVNDGDMGGRDWIIIKGTND